MKTLVLLSLLLTANIVQAKDKAAWGTLSWGMTRGEVLAHYPAARPNIVNGSEVPDYLVMEGFSINDLPFSVGFLFNDKSELASVILMAAHLMTEYESSAIVDDYLSKYGRPVRDYSRGKNMDIFWTASTLEIKLVFDPNTSEKPNFVVVYSPPKNLDGI